jgi:DNA topoisomerase I
VTGSVLKFDGFLKVYEESKDGKDEEDEELKHKLPALEAGQKLTLKELKPEQHFTEPPPRYNEASLVKELEERGIGRPSTYSAILRPFRSGSTSRSWAGNSPPRKLDWWSPICWWKTSATSSIVQYTARLEEELDEIEEGKEKWTDALGEFYKKFQKDLKYAEKHMENIKRMEKPTDEKCERCGSPLVIKWGKHGSFYACSTYDKEDPNTCTFTKENPINLPDLDSADVQETTQEEYCENCGRVMVLKRGRFGQFMACTGYPDCKTTRRLDQGKKVPRHSARRAVPEMRTQYDDSPRPLRRVHGLQRLSRVQIRQAEFHWREVPGVQGRGPGREARPQGQHVLRLRNYPKCKFTSATSRLRKSVPVAAANIWSKRI